MLWTAHLDMLTTAHAPYSYKNHCQNSNFSNATGCFDLSTIIIIKKKTGKFFTSLEKNFLLGQWAWQCVT